MVKGEDKDFERISVKNSSVLVKAVLVF